MGELDPRRLETFRVVASAGQISAAARQLHLSQPTVTAQIRQLEESLGRPLFERTARGMQLNEAGVSLLGFAERHRALLEEARRVVEKEKEPQGQLHLAASTTTVGAVLPQLLAGFARRFPRVGVRVDVANTHVVLDAVRSGRVPLGLVEGHSRATGVHLERLTDDELIPIVGADVESPRHLNDLNSMRIVWREVGSGTRAIVEKSLRAAGSTRKPRSGDLEIGSNEAILRLVERGVGLAFVSRASVEPALLAGRIRFASVPRLRMRRAFSWVLQGVNAPGLAGRFLDFARRNQGT